MILLLNRRGFSTHIQCPACGHVVRCPDCDIALTHHRTEEIALCHYCDYEVPAPTACPACDFAGIRYSGLGTQRLEAEVRARFPNVPGLRMDTDTMQAHGSHERALAEFRSGKVRILLGTQMIAKGLDFPNVTLVGVINADTALHLPDFRAAERTFHLVTQVAGRTGRGPEGRPGAGADLQPRSSGHPGGGAARLRGVCGRRAAHPPDAPLSAVCQHDPAGDPRPGGAGRRRSLPAYMAERLAAAAGSQRQADARVLGPAPAPSPG